jgi:hypothetical protein
MSHTALVAGAVLVAATARAGAPARPNVVVDRAGFTPYEKKLDADLERTLEPVLPTRAATR